MLMPRVYRFSRVCFVGLVVAAGIIARRRLVVAGEIYRFYRSMSRLSRFWGKRCSRRLHFINIGELISAADFGRLAPVQAYDYRGRL